MVPRTAVHDGPVCAYFLFKTSSLALDMLSPKTVDKTPLLSSVTMRSFLYIILFFDRFKILIAIGKFYPKF